MTRKHKKQAPYTDASVTLDPALSLGSIRKPGGLDEAKSCISRHTSRSSPAEYERIIRGLSASPDVLALLLVSCSELLQMTTARLLEDSPFPGSTESYRSSCQGTMLIAFHKFWSSIQPPGDVDTVEFQLRTKAIFAAHILISKELDSAFEFERPSPSSSHSQKKRKQLQKHVTATSVSFVAQNAFECLGEEQPHTLDEKHELVKRLLDRQEATLKYFLLDVFTRPSTALLVNTVVLRIVEAPQACDIPIIQESSTDLAKHNPQPPAAEPDPEDANAFSWILPAKARYIFDTPDGWGDWHLFLAGRAIKHLRSFRKAEQNKFHIVQKKIKELSQGFFSPSNQKYLVGGGTDVHIFEAKLDRDQRLVYRIDLQTDDEGKVDRQVILIYGIYTHAQLDKRLWSQVAHFSPRGGAEYRRRCEYRAETLVHGANTNNITPPMEWPHEDYTISAKPPPPDYSEEGFLELHRICALEKFVPLTNALLQTILADVDAIHQFAVSPSEKRIVNHEGSCFVVGRSGTGKTTTMVFKMLAVEMTDRRMQSSDRPSRLRQMFLTQSHVLARRVEEYYVQLLHAAKFQYSTTHQMRPVEEDLLDLDEDDDERGDLPTKFSELEDKHFPLFATFDQIRRMLENDLGITFSRKEAVQRRKRANGLMESETPDAFNADSLSLVEDAFLDQSGNASNLLAKRHFVSFSVFLRDYWPHFDQKLTKGLDPALVFSEIMGAIRGHEDTVTSEAGYLDKQSYLSLSHRTHSSLSLHRERVYGIFENYIRMKQEQGMFDGPDRTHNILRAFRSRIPGKIDFIYVDEVQDLLIIDTKLLRDVCPNPCGFFWGGDTAQSISVGSSFRFEDLKAFMWREEESHPHVKAKLRKPIHPYTFQLLTNYRSHGGIVDCAASLIGLLSSLFPYSIDKLKKESALVPGPKPRIFLSNVVHFEEFLNPVGESRLDFGAHQVIIVRDNVARSKLHEVLGESGLILTLLESKGLEFDDVLLYDFFASSPFPINQWRIINSDNHRDVEKHRTLESELKRLYVAITRARHHCWIWESEPLRHPMIEHWTARELVKLHAPADPIPALATQSTPEQWNNRGRTLFGRKLFPQAASCFEKAGRKLERDICKAYELHEEARRSSTHQDRSFTTAAEELRRCAESAVQDSTTALRLHKKAAECFVEAGDLPSAAKSYISALDFNTAARLYRKAGMFEEAVALIKPTGGQPSLVDKRVGDEIIRVARFQFARKNNLRQMDLVFEGKIDEQLEYLELYGFQSAQIPLHIRRGDYRAAGELHQQLGELDLAVECFLQSTETDVRRRAITSVLERLQRVAFGATFTKESIRALHLLDNVSEEDFNDQDKIMVKIFRAVSNGVRTDLKALAWGNRGDAFIRVLCQNQAILCPGFCIEALDLRALLHEVEFQLHYFRSLLSMINLHKNLCHQHNAALLLGIRPATGPGWEHLVDFFTVEKDSYLGRAYEKSSTLPGATEHQGTVIVLSAHELDQLARKTVEAEIEVSLLGLHDKLKGMSILRPCMDAAVYGSCNRYSCAKDHTAIASPNYPSLIVRVLVQIICVLNCLWGLSRHERWREIHWVWIRKLFDSFQPLTHRLACASLHYGISSGEESIRIVQKWIDDMVFDTQPHGPNERFFLSNCILLSWMISTMYNVGVPRYFGRARIMLRRPDLIRGEVSIIEDLLAAIARLHPDENRLSRGILAIKHIMDNQLQVDLLFLVSYLEQLSLEILISFSQNLNLGFHNLLLPRSWVLRLIRGPPRSPCRNPPVSVLYTSVGTLMTRVILWNGAGPLLLDRKPLTLASLPRNLLLARICRLLVIAGFRGSYRVRDDILRTIRTSLNVGEVKHNFLYAKYASARDWRDLVNALLESGTTKDHDHLVHLHELQQGYVQPMKNVRVIVLQTPNNPKNIEDALFPPENPTSSRPPVLQAETSVPAAQLPNAPSPAPTGVATGPGAIDVDTDITPTLEPADAAMVAAQPQKASIPATTDATAEPEALGVDTDILPLLEAADGQNGEGKDDGDIDEDPSVKLDLSQTMELPPGPDEEDAARRIQLWYRRSFRRRRSTQDPTLAKNHAACMADSPNILNHPYCNRHFYLAVTRGPMAHALCVLDRLQANCAELKRGISKKIREVRHEELERAQEGADRVIALMRETSAQRKNIAPGGVVFRSGHITMLRAAVRGVVDFARQAKEQLGLRDTEALDEDIEITFKGIIQTPQAPAPMQREEKPQLNVEDLGYWA